MAGLGVALNVENPNYHLFFGGKQDSTMEFEKRRNVPVRYNRELMGTTLKAMKRISEIKAKRERVFARKR